MRPVRLPVGPGEESVWDYPRPPALERVAERVSIVHRGVRLVDTDRAWRVLETSHPPTYYVPPSGIAVDHLVESDRTSFCEFKGLAAYRSVEIDGEVLRDVAWGYPDPSPGYEPIADHLAFYAGPFDECRVGDERATPQPGGFYGGWVTSRIVGPFKGEPGTSGW
jgi:uncharacterized protein (DUF427 family)